MRCEHVTAYLPGYAGGDLRRETARTVARHLAGCSACRSETVRLERVTSGLRALSEQPLEPPAGLVDAVLEGAIEKRRSILPVVPPSLAPDLVRLVQENREAIAQAGATALVAAGTAFALWRTLKSKRAASQPASY